MAVSSAGSERVADPIRGISLKIVSVMVFVCMQTSLKLGGEGIPAGEVVA